MHEIDIYTGQEDTMTLTVIWEHATQNIESVLTAIRSIHFRASQLTLRCIDATNEPEFRLQLEKNLSTLSHISTEYVHLSTSVNIGSIGLINAIDIQGLSVQYALTHCHTTYQSICTADQLPKGSQLFKLLQILQTKDNAAIVWSDSTIISVDETTKVEKIQICNTQNSFHFLCNQHQMYACAFIPNVYWKKLFSESLHACNITLYECTHLRAEDCIPETNKSAIIPTITPQIHKPSILGILPINGSNIPLLEKCMHALEYGSYGVFLRVVIVINPIEMGHTEEVKKAVGNRAEVISIPGPFNFPRSMNAGIAALKDEKYILFLNDDCFLQKPDDLQRLVYTLEQEKLACIGPWIDNMESKQDGYGDTKWCGHFRLTQHPVMGCCALWSTKWLKKIGPLDEQFGIGYGGDESDLTWRARNLGARWGRQENVVVQHIHHATFGKDIAKSKAHDDNLERWRLKYGDLACWGGSKQWDPLPGIQVSIAAHNAAKWLESCLTSIEKALDGYRWILTVMDDASTDDTRNILEQWHTSADHKIIETCAKCKGAADAKNKAIALGKDFAKEYPILCLMDADDSMTEERIRSLLPTMIDNHYSVVFGDYTITNVRGNTQTKQANLLSQKIGTHIHPCSTLIHRNIIPEDNILFNPDLTQFEDENLWRKWYELGITMQPIPGTPVHHYIQHGDSVMKYEKSTLQDIPPLN